MRRMLSVFLVLVLAAGLAAGCRVGLRREELLPPPETEPPPAGDVRATVFYFPDQTHSYLVPVLYYIPWEEGIARATVSRMVDGSVPESILAQGLAPLLPAGTQILGLTIRDGLARIDFSRQLLDVHPDHARLMVDGLVYTLTEFPTISKVEILVEGEKAPVLPGNEPMDEILDRQRGINISVSDSVNDFSRTAKVVVYFIHNSGAAAYYVPVTRIVEDDADPLQQTAEELLKGPSYGSNLTTAIPRGVELEGLSLDGSRVTLRLAGPLVATGGGQAAADLICNQIVLSMTELAGIDEVEVLHEGKPPRFPAGVVFPEVAARPKLWNVVPQSGASQGIE